MTFDIEKKARELYCKLRGFFLPNVLSSEIERIVEVDLREAVAEGRRIAHEDGYICVPHGSCACKDCATILIRAEAKLSAYESAGPEDEETKAALLRNPPDCVWGTCKSEDHNITCPQYNIMVLKRALRAAWARIRELEKKA